MRRPTNSDPGTPKEQTSPQQNWFYLILLALIGALTYLPLANQLGLFKDDWFLIYDAHSQGSAFFHEIYAIDRPARGYVMQFAYELFGDRILFYHISAYLFRVIAGWAFFLALEMTWGKHRRHHFVAALLFLLYPGFLSQINPIDYQAQILSMSLALVSIAATLTSIQSVGIPRKSVWVALAIVTGIVYPALVEYAIGLEVLRFGLIVQFALKQKGLTLRQLAGQVARLWVPSLTAPVVFLVWRLFIFESARQSTDVGIQLGQLFASPLTGLWWLVHWAQDILRVTFLAWAIPFHNLLFGLRLRDTYIAAGVGLLAASLALGGVIRLGRADTTAREERSPHPAWQKQTMWTGFAAAAIALLPVIIVNRHADFGEYTRYAFASAPGVAMLIAALLTFITSARAQFAVVALLTFVASVTHFSNAVRGALETEEVRNFWWQVSWRAPDLQEGVTLVASYPSAPIQEDYFIWGPANLIYRPQPQPEIPIEIPLPSAVLTPDVIAQILTGVGEETPLRRGNSLTRAFDRIVFFVQARDNTCMRILNGDAPELSIYDSERTMLIASRSDLSVILPQGDSPAPPADLFGDEPAHAWCYYYQKADLARQRGDWEEVARLGAEAQKLGLTPNDPIEWMPFLQAYAYLQNQKQVKLLSTRINVENLYQQQACRYLVEQPPAGYVLSPEMHGFAQKLFC
jgi:hypothetical protein